LERPVPQGGEFMAAYGRRCGVGNEERNIVEWSYVLYGGQ